MLDLVFVFWRLSKGQRLRYGGAILCLLISNLFLFTAPLIPGAALNGLMRTASGSSFGVEAMARILDGRLWAGALGLVLLTGLGGLFSYLRGRLAAQAAESIVRGVREELCEHLQHLPVRYHDRNSTGDLVQRCTSDVETLRTFLASQVVEIAQGLGLLLVGLPMMLGIDVAMTGVSVALLPIVLVFGVVFFRKVQARFLEVDESEGRMSARLQENLTGMRVVRAFGRQKDECVRWGRVIGDYRDRHARLFRLLAWYWASSDFLCFSQLGLVLLTGVGRVASGTLAVGEMFVFLAYVQMFLWPVRQMGRILTDLGKALVSLGRIREILDEPREANGPHLALVPPPPPKGRISFEGVSFAHGAKSVLRNVSFTVEPGQTLAILGPAGAGKSTLVQLLLRFYEPDRGRITLDGVDIRSLDRQWLRSQFGAVLQEPFLYSRTVGQNIKLARPAAPDEEMFAAARAACVEEAVERLTHGYQTRLGERGVNLSGGQRQRLALARALLPRTPVLLLDDALSAVDSETEEAILQALRLRRGHQTTLLIAHRLSSVMEADQILVLEDGHVVQSGTHQSLLGQAGRYLRLWNIQCGLEEEVAGHVRDRFAR